MAVRICSSWLICFLFSFLILIGVNIIKLNKFIDINIVKMIGQVKIQNYVQFLIAV